MNYFKLKIDLSSEEEAKILYEAIYLEHIDSQIRSKAKMEREGRSIKIYVEAEDLSILKASIYSYLRWLTVAQNIYKICRRVKDNG
ncbi:KEOPS complex subunit Pcc1 [Methanocaldococcus sp.]